MKRRIFVVAVMVFAALAGAAAGWVVGGTRSAGFVSTASVEILPLKGNPYWDGSVRDIVVLQTEAQQARSDAVLEAVDMTPADTPDVAILRRRLTVAVAPGTEVLELSYKGSDASVTQAVAAQLAKALLDVRENRADDVRNNQIDAVKAAQEEVANLLLETQDPASQRVLTQRQILLRDQLAELEGDTLLAGQEIGVTTKSASRQTMQIAIAVVGGVVGAVFGWLLARRMLRWRIRKSVNA